MILTANILFDTLYKTLNMNEQQNKETEEIVAQNPQICCSQHLSTEYDENFSLGYNTSDTFSSKNYGPSLDLGHVNEGFEEDIINKLSNAIRYFSIFHLMGNKMVHKAP